jgi:hypothetical protein
MIYGMFNDIMEAGAVLMVNFEFISFLKFCGQFHIFFCHTWAQFFHLTQKQHFEFNSIPCNYRQYLLCIFCLQAHKISVIDNVMVSQCSTFRISSGTLREKNDEKYHCYSSQNQKLGICSQTSWQRYVSRLKTVKSIFPNTDQKCWFFSIIYTLWPTWWFIHTEVNCILIGSSNCRRCWRAFNSSISVVPPAYITSWKESVPLREK